MGRIRGFGIIKGIGFVLGKDVREGLEGRIIRLGGHGQGQLHRAKE